MYQSNTPYDMKQACSLIFSCLSGQKILLFILRIFGFMSWVRIKSTHRTPAKKIRRAIAKYRSSTLLFIISKAKVESVYLVFWLIILSHNSLCNVCTQQFYWYVSSLMAKLASTWILKWNKASRHVTSSSRASSIWYVDLVHSFRKQVNNRMPQICSRNHYSLCEILSMIFDLYIEYGMTFVYNANQMPHGTKCYVVEAASWALLGKTITWRESPTSGG